MFYGGGYWIVVLEKPLTGAVHLEVKYFTLAQLLPPWLCPPPFHTHPHTHTYTHNPKPFTVYTKHYSTFHRILYRASALVFPILLSEPFSPLLTPPALIFTFHPFLLMFCCVLVKSQLATVSRSLAALTMASGIMLNTAPRLLSPSTSISDALWSTQERDGGLSMKMSLQLHKHISQTPSVSALPPLSSPHPHF